MSYSEEKPAASCWRGSFLAAARLPVHAVFRFLFCRQHGNFFSHVLYHLSSSPPLPQVYEWYFPDRLWRTMGYEPYVVTAIGGPVPRLVQVDLEDMFPPGISVLEKSQFLRYGLEFGLLTKKSHDPEAEVWVKDREIGAGGLGRDIEKSGARHTLDFAHAQGIDLQLDAVEFYHKGGGSSSSSVGVGPAPGSVGPGPGEDPAPDVVGPPTVSVRAPPERPPDAVFSLTDPRPFPNTVFIMCAEWPNISHFTRFIVWVFELFSSAWFYEWVVRARLKIYIVPML